MSVARRGRSYTLEMQGADALWANLDQWEKEPAHDFFSLYPDRPYQELQNIWRQNHED